MEGQELYLSSRANRFKDSKKRREEAESCLCPLSPMLRSFSLFGLYTSSDVGMCKRILRFLHTSIIFAGLHYWAVLYLNNLVFLSGNLKVFNQALIIWTSVASYDVFLFHRKQIQDFVLYFLHDKKFPLPSMWKRKYHRIVRYFNIIVWVYALAWTTTFLVIPTKKIPEEHFSDGFYSLIANRTSLRNQKYLIQLNDGTVCLLLEGNLTFCVVFYIMCLYGCILWCKKYERILLRHSKSKDFDMQYVQELYAVLFKRVQTLDSAFSLSVMCWYLMFTVALCIRVVAILTEDTSKLDIQAVLNIGFGLCRGMFLIMLTTSFLSQHLTDLAKKVVLGIDKCIGSCQNLVVLHEYSNLLRSIRVKPVEMTLWKFCPLGKPLLMSCVQTMTTYVFISLQMSSDADGMESETPCNGMFGDHNATLHL